MLLSYHPCEVLEKKKDGDTTYYSVKVRKWKNEGENYDD